MPTLILRLAGPLQSWGEGSRFNHRHTREEPTKSGVLGLLAAAQGRRRSDSIEDLLHLKFGVRADQPGRLVRDFQTEIDWRTNKARPLTYRYYLADAAFLAVVEGGEEMIAVLHSALHHPVFPLYLGRRACPPAGPVWLGIRDSDLRETLLSEPWQAAGWYRKKQPRSVTLEIVRDAEPDEKIAEAVRDEPLSFSESARDYGWRDVVREPMTIDNPLGRQRAHDPMALLGGDE